MSNATGYESSAGGASEKVAQRRVHGAEEIVETSSENEDTSKLKPFETKKSGLAFLESIAMPIIFTGLAFFLRMYKIGLNEHVVWDEAHFGKFGSYYLRHEFYHDVHPPLGKMLVGLSGYLAGYNGSYDFISGELYPDYVDYVKMRLFNAAFSALCVPLAYFTAKTIGFSLPSVWLFTILVLFENSFTTLGKFILLDSMLLFFTVASFYCFVMYHKQRSRPFSRKWWKWILLTGISLGCAISVKMVGLLIILTVGFYVVGELWIFLGDKRMSWKTYAQHWLARIVCLIIVPFLVFLLCFKVHFDLLSHSGTGDANMPSLFQANLVGSEVGQGPRDVAVGSSLVSIKNQALGGSLLHSHVQTFPEGSHQQQVTGYGYKDSNNEWFFDRARGLPHYDESETDDEFVANEGQYRLVHNNTAVNLHTHNIAAPMSKSAWEVSGYGNEKIGDEKDNWIVEVVAQQGKENSSRLHPLTSSFRLKNAVLGCYLAQTGYHLPEWGFRQSEIACLRSPFKRDKRTWWNIESHVNDVLPPRPDNFKYPKTNFLKDFIHLNLAMMATNNALIPESDKLDGLASSAWQWPTLNLGLRLNGWGEESARYFLLGLPFSTWPSTAAVVCFAALVIVLVLRWQRQFSDLADPQDLNVFLVGGIFPMLAWGLHFTPFVIMSRVTYVHHYLPALYFALLVLTYMFDAGMKNWTKSKCGSIMRLAIYGTYYAVIIAGFLYFSPISFGMEGPVSDYEYLDWLPGWYISNKNK